MKQIKLSYNQSKKLIWNDQEITVRQNGMVLYLVAYADGIIAKDMSGEQVNVSIKIDECFE